MVERLISEERTGRPRWLGLRDTPALARMHWLSSHSPTYKWTEGTMKTTRKLGRLAAVVGLLGCLTALAFSATAAAATTTLTFTEPEKGSTFTFVDNAPMSQKKHGFP